MNNDITFVCGSLRMGGPQRVMVDLANEFAERNKRINFIVTVDNTEHYKLSNKIRHIPSPNFSKNRIMRTIQKLCWYRKLLKFEVSDVTVSFWHNVNMYLLLANIGIGKKIIISERNDPNNEPENSILRLIRNWLYKKADFIVFQTPDAENYYKNRFKNLNSKVILNPIKSDLPKPNKEGDLREKKIVTFGRITPQKNLHLLIDAFELIHEEYPNYCLELFGDGKSKSEIIQYIKLKELEDFITINDFSINILEKIKSYTMYVSSSNYEGISNSLIESMAVGLPVVSTDCPIGGARMMIQNTQNGLIVPMQDKKEMYKAMKFYIENPIKREEIAIEGIKTRQRLNIEAIIEEWENVIENVKSTKK